MKIQFSLSDTQNRFRYAMVYRPPSLGTCPKDFIAVEPRPAVGHPHHDIARHGIVVYDRRLSDLETKNFELAFIADGHDLDVIAHKVAKAMLKYASAYIEMSEIESEQFVQTCKDVLGRTSTGFVPSIGDAKVFAQLVVKHLRNYHD